MKKAYIATVQLLITGVNDEAEACDYVSETLRGSFTDWGYLRIGGQLLGPSEKFIDSNYEEGDMFTE